MLLICFEFLEENHIQHLSPNDINCKNLDLEVLCCVFFVPLPTKSFRIPVLISFGYQPTNLILMLRFLKIASQISLPYLSNYVCESY